MSDLKHYDRYMTVLKRLAKTLRIKVIVKEDPDDAWWSSARRAIKLDKDLTEGEMVAAFLHELGHSFDDTLIGPSKKTEKAYANYYRNLHTPKQWRLVLDREKAAWRFARVIARMGGIPLGRWFYRYETQCLAGYKP